jgi:ABC-type branched-subunit amino acid transport system ATPase component
VSFGGRPVVVGASIGSRRRGGGTVSTNGGQDHADELISGFVRRGRDRGVRQSRIDNIASYRRARHGMGRAFQNARSFGGLSARETIMVALEARERSLLVPSLLAVPPSPMAERRKRKQADEIMATWVGR